MENNMVDYEIRTASRDEIITADGNSTPLFNYMETSFKDEGLCFGETPEKIADLADDKLVLLATTNGNVIAYLNGELRYSKNSHTVFKGHHLYVSKDKIKDDESEKTYRENGIGTKMLNMQIENVRERGAREFQFYLDFCNEDGYERAMYYLEKNMKITNYDPDALVTGRVGMSKVMADKKEADPIKPPFEPQWYTGKQLYFEDIKIDSDKIPDNHFLYKQLGEGRIDEFAVLMPKDIDRETFNKTMFGNIVAGGTNITNIVEYEEGYALFFETWEKIASTIYGIISANIMLASLGRFRNPEERINLEEAAIQYQLNAMVPSPIRNGVYPKGFENMKEIGDKRYASLKQEVEKLESYHRNELEDSRIFMNSGNPSFITMGRVPSELIDLDLVPGNVKSPVETGYGGQVLVSVSLPENPVNDPAKDDFMKGMFNCLLGLHTEILQGGVDLEEGEQTYREEFDSSPSRKKVRKHIQ